MKNNVMFMTIFGTVLLTAIIAGLATHATVSVFGSVEHSGLLIVNLHLDECIKQLQLGNAVDALDHCQLANQELDALLKNVTE